MSSMSSALSSPAPGPATIRLTLIRVGIELFGHDYMQHSLFPSLLSMKILIRPPQKVALSFQVLRAYKPDEKNTDKTRESVIYREMAHADGPLTVYLQVPQQEAEQWAKLLHLIGYWGQANSFTCCLGLSQTTPIQEECAQPLTQLSEQAVLHPFFACLLTEFRDSTISWDEVMSSSNAPSRSNFLTLDLYLWPLLRSPHPTGQLLTHMPFP
jgi:hypothetical protein